MVFIELTDRFEERIVISITSIQYMYVEEENDEVFTAIVFKDQTIYVKETLEQILSKVKV